MLTHAAHTSYMFELATETEAVSAFSPWGYFSACSDPFEVVPESPFRWKTTMLSFSLSSAVHTFLPITALVIFSSLSCRPLPPVHVLASIVKKYFCICSIVFTLILVSFLVILLWCLAFLPVHTLFTEAIELFFYRMQLVWYKIQPF